MDISTYETLTGKTVSTSQETYYEALIAKAQSQLEGILGYSLVIPAVAGVRYFDYHKDDKYVSIDPFTSITSIELVEDAEVIYTLTSEDYRTHTKYGILKHLELCCVCPQNCYKCIQWKITAQWLFATIPTDLQYLLADMVTFDADPANNIKSQTLGTHSYTKVDVRRPEYKKESQLVIGKYAGPNGSGIQIPTI